MGKRIIVWVVLLVFGIIIGVVASQFYHSINDDIKTTGSDINGHVMQGTENIEDEKSENKDKLERVLVGMWHASPSVGAGYNDCYEFCEDKTFKFTHSQYDGENRLVDFSGKWEVIHDNLLFLTITDKTIIEGGEFTKNVTSELTEYVLLNGNLTKRQVNPPEEVIYPLKDLEINEEYHYPVMLKIGGLQYWKLGSKASDLLE